MDVITTASLGFISNARLFTPQFFRLSGFTLVTFGATFLLFPTMPFHLIEAGGSRAEAGLFLGFVTFGSAFSAPLCGACADRFGRRPILLVSSIAILCLSGLYAVASLLWTILALALIHGIFWSALLSSSAALMVDIAPETRRAEAIGYWGLAGVLAIAVAPSCGFWVLEYGWGWVCLTSGVLAVGMFMIGLGFQSGSTRSECAMQGACTTWLVDKRVLILSITLFLYNFAYGGITSFVALYTQDNSTAPKGIFFVVFAIVIVVSRPILGRMADRKGRTQVLLPCLGLMAVGVGLLAISAQWPLLLLSATFFGVGFGSAYPVFAAYILDQVDARRRGAAFGSILLSMNTGIGFGSMLFGLVVERSGYRSAFVLGGLLSLGAIPYFRFAQKRLNWPNGRSSLKSTLESQLQSRLQQAYPPEDPPHRRDGLVDDYRSIPPRLH